jgi:hypothetical protein
MWTPVPLAVEAGREGLGVLAEAAAAAAAVAVAEESTMSEMNCKSPPDDDFE